MFDYLGEKIRAGVLANLPWVSRSAGLTVPVMAADSGRFYPGALPYTGHPCRDTGDYINMSPQEGETAICFFDTEGELRVFGQNTRFQQIETFFRVVVWYDSRKITIPGTALSTGLQMAIAAGVQAVDFNTDGLSGCRAYFHNFTADASRIWARYGMADSRAALFLMPYQTFAITFKFIARFRAECFTGEITADADAC